MCRNMVRPAVSFGICVMAVGFVPATLAQSEKPNILVIWGDDIGQTNISAYSLGVMGYRTPNIDRMRRKA